MLDKGKQWACWSGFPLLCALMGPASFAATNPARAVPTFESIGLYWVPDVPPADPGAGCQVSFRAAPEESWSSGLPLWFDARNNECRGSLVHLRPGTRYEIRLTAEGSSEALIEASTWSEEFPVARRIYLPEFSTVPLLVDQSGSESGYVVYEPEPGRSATIDVQRQYDYNLLVNAHHVIIRGLTLRGSRRNGIVLGISRSSSADGSAFANPDYVDPSHPNVTDVVIEHNDISGWGSPSSGDTRYGTNLDSAIQSASSKLTRIVVQRNRLHHPFTDANNWKELNLNTGGKHPQGPQGISFSNSLGNIVIRYNEIYSDREHRFNDGMGELKNFSGRGFPSRDTDIYCNFISHVWDDAIESEGGNQNVRIWGNYLDQAYHPLGVAPTFIGPFYIWRNLSHVSRTSDVDSYGQAYFKFRNASGAGDFGGGRSYLFNNAALRPPAAEGSGTGAFLRDNGEVDNLRSFRTLNNIMQVAKATSDHSLRDRYGVDNAFDYDLFNGLMAIGPGQEAHGVSGTPKFVSGWGLDYHRKLGDFSLASDSPGFNAGTFIPNFVDTVHDGLPDIAPQEAGAPAMEFGVQAYVDEFLPLSSVPPNSTQTSNSVRVRDVQPGTAILVAGGSYSVNGAPFTSDPGRVNDGDLIRARLTSSSEAGGLSAVELTLGETPLRFEVRSHGTDSSPDPMSFPDVLDANPGSLVASNFLILSGIDKPVPLSVTGGEYSLNGALYRAVGGTARNGDSLQLRVRASSQSSGTAQMGVQVGDTAATFTVRSGKGDDEPDLFTFPGQTNVEPSALATSAQIQILGIDVEVPVTVVSGEYCLNDAPCTSEPGVARVQDRIRLRHFASSEYLKQHETIVSVGARSASFVSTTRAADEDPDPFAFTSVLGAEPSTLLTSEAISVSGVEGSVRVAVVGGEYCLNSDPCTDVSGTVQNGDRVRVRHLSATEFLTQTHTSLTVGSRSADFSSQTRERDQIPDPFQFTSRTGVTPGARIDSNTVTLAGFEGELSVSVSGGQYCLGSAACTSSPGVVSAGTSIRLSHVAASTGNTETVTTVSVGAASASFKSTTAAIADAVDTTPDSFAFAERLDVETGRTYDSDPVTISGINSPAPVSVSNGSYSINGGAFTSNSGTIRNGETLRLRNLSASSAGQRSSTTVNVGGVVAAFTTQTRAATTDTTPDPFTFPSVTKVSTGSKVTSQTVRITGINAPAPISVQGGYYSINGGPFTGVAGTIRLNDSLRLRHRAATKPKTKVTTTVTVGGYSTTFSSTTK